VGVRMQVMSTARVYRRLSVPDDESVTMLFRVDEFPSSLSLDVIFDADRELRHLAVRRMTGGDQVPAWYRAGEPVKVFLVIVYYRFLGLQCFDAVGWAAGRASGL